MSEPQPDDVAGALTRLEEQVTQLHDEERRIGGVMVGAWVLVALIEWAASRADRRPEQPVYVAAQSIPVAADPAWFSPPVEHTLLEGADGDGDTAVTRLPPRLDDAEATVEQRR